MTIEHPQALKRAALLFDHIALAGVQFLSKCNERYKSDLYYHVLANIEWLVEQGVVVLAPPNFDESIFRTFVSDGVLQFPEKFLEELAEQQRHRPLKVKVSSTKIEGPIVIGQSHTTYVSEEWTREAAIRLREDHDWETITLGCGASGVDREFNPGSDDVVRVILNAFPEPDDSTPWEAIIDFREDDAAKAKFHRLRNHIARLSKAEVAPVILASEIQEMMFEYEEYMRMHRIKVGVGVLETVLTTTAEVIEHILKLRWGSAAKSLFQVRKQKVALYEAERAAPGRELAYIVDANRRFGRRA